MAKIISETIIIKLSKLVKDNYDTDNILSNDQLETLTSSVPDLVESIVEDESIIVEIVSE